MTTDNGLYRFPVTYEGLPQAQPFTVSADGDTLENDLILADTPQDLKLTVTMAQYTALLSAALNGANRHYGENYIDVIYPLIKAGKNLAIDMSCLDVADCVESELITNETLINSITNAVNQNGFGNPNRVNGTQTRIQDRNAADFNTTEVASLENCNLDKLWGGIRHGIVERLDENLQDMLQDLAAIPTIIGRNAAWLDIIPVLGDIAEAVVTSLSGAVPSLQTLFESYSSEATKDELACELFAIVCAECRYPTFEEIYNHFKNYGKPETPEIGAWVLETMTDLLTDPVGVVAKVAYFTLMTWQLGILYLQAKINGKTGTNAILQFVRLGEDFESNNWFDLCATCNETYAIEVWDFTTQGAGEWYADTNPSTSKNQFVAGKGWMGTQLSTGRRIDVYRAFDPAWEIRGIAFNIGGTPGAATQQWNRRTSFGTGGTLSAAGSAGGGYSRCFSGYAGLTGYSEIGIFVNGALANEFYLEKVAILYVNGNAPGTATPTNDATPCP